ncbi:MAG: hypothetical protein JSR64_09755 [Nitrospira sp.]|nr:hypothetical protein [Nitrospira sp.]MBS0194365.1 hypothetical protein [Pseudomonadota bacterium]
MAAVPWIARLRHWREVQQVQAQIHRQAIPAIPELHSVTPNEAVWRIPVPRQSDCFLALEKHNYPPPEEHVVFIDATRFYLAWLKGDQYIRTSPHGDSVMARKDMHLDYKYANVDRYMQGSKRILWLPEPHYLQLGGRHGRIRFTNGITRTLWLLSHNCQAFPARVSTHAEAVALHNVAGLQMICTAELFALTLTTNKVDAQ